MSESFFNKFADPQVCNSIKTCSKKSLQHRSFPLSIAKKFL